jgi:alcohol dehydrogenase class IV
MTITRAFVHHALPMRTVFGHGSLDRLADEADRLGLRRVLVLSTPRRRDLAQTAAALLGARTVDIYDRATMHVPIEVAEAAADKARRLNTDGTVAIGGGSTIGLAKAIALRLDLPILAVPTTYAGSEMTPVWGQTEAGVKTTERDLRVLPRTTIYDSELTLGLPADISGQSGINAIAHCVEALYAENANPVTSLMAEEGIRALAGSLPRVVADGGDISARDEALFGAWLAGVVLGEAGVALHHKLCHTLGGSFNLPHATVHTIVLPHAVAYNREAAPAAMARIARALGATDAAGGLFDLATALGAPVALEAIGMREDALDRAAELALANPYYNPRPMTLAGVRALLDDAQVGRRPTV